MTASDTPPPRRSRLWVRVLLVLSLAFNLLIVGVIVGWVATKGRPDGAISAGRGVGAEPFVRALNPPERRALLRDLAREAPRLRENRAALRDRFERLVVAMTATPYDPAAVEEVLAAQRSAAVERQAIGERLLLARLAEMTDAERAAYAQRLSEALRRPRRN